ncbi:hypothetical protein CB1_000345013 [Camelus ferus]|nr:hypothetical protein CB1_000345013 [Camelus ferus]
MGPARCMYVSEGPLRHAPEPVVSSGSKNIASTSNSAESWEAKVSFAVSSSGVLPSHRETLRCLSRCPRGQGRPATPPSLLSTQVQTATRGHEVASPNRHGGTRQPDKTVVPPRQTVRWLGSAVPFVNNDDLFY